MPTESEYDLRTQVIKKLRDQGIPPFPSTSNRTITVQGYLDGFDKREESDEETIAGRVMLFRAHGKIAFFQLQDESGRMQVVLSKQERGEQAFAFAGEFVDIGDIVECAGVPFTTKKGERSLLATSVRLLAKAIQPLPDKWHGIQDEETRYRKRYIDILLNPELQEMIRKKSAFWNAMRQFLVEQGFLEVQTPVLEAVPGGADAEPFITHHNALDIDLYLRISMGELWQKRLMVAGFEKTFEIGRQFRNEGISPEHLQDYTQMEFYWAYADYEKGMGLVEQLYKHVIQQTFGKLQFTIHGKEINFDQEWERLDYIQAVKDKLGIDVAAANDEALRSKCGELGVPIEQAAARGRLIDLLWKQCRKDVDGPVFLTNHPVEVSPLAKRSADDPSRVERFQVIVAGSEIGNGYSELNDPIDQAERFAEQAKMRAEGDPEAQMHDQEFVEALEYGMPPTCGFGVSERLFSFLMDKPIRECVIFPLLRPKHDTNNDTNA